MVLADRPQTIGVLSWNVWWNFAETRYEMRRSEWARQASASGASLIGLQEGFDDGETNDAAQLAEDLDMGLASVGVEIEPGRWCTCSVLSRWPITDWDGFELPVRRGARPRRAVWARIGAPGGEFVALSVHLSPDFDGSLNRQMQLERISHLARDLSRSMDGGLVVLCGDLNATPESDEIRRLTGQAAPYVDGFVFNDCWPQVRDGGGWTWARENPHTRGSMWRQRRLDYVLVSWPRAQPIGNPLEACLIGRPDTDGIWPSDHLGVLVTLCVSRACDDDLAGGIDDGR